MLLPDAVNRLIPLSLLLGLASSAWAAQPVLIERNDPRLFGYQMGDVLTEQVQIHLAPGYALDPQSLPRAGKRAGWFLVRATDVHEVATDDGGRVLALQIELQLTNSPRQARALTVPPIALRFKGPEARTETIPSLTIDAVPLGTGDVRTGLPDVRGLRAAPLVATEPAERQLRVIGALSAAALVWLLIALLLRRWSQRRARPFADASRDLRALARAAGTPEGARALLQRMHRAFDQAAGHRLFSEGVVAFCQRMGADAELQRRTQQFFAASQAAFFDTTGTPLPATLATELRALCQAWRRFEGRHS